MGRETSAGAYLRSRLERERFAAPREPDPELREDEDVLWSDGPPLRNAGAERDTADRDTAGALLGEKVVVAPRTDIPPLGEDKDERRGAGVILRGPEDGAGVVRGASSERGAVKLRGASRERGAVKVRGVSLARGRLKLRGVSILKSLPRDAAPSMIFGPEENVLDGDE